MNNIKNDSNEEININAINNKSFFFFFFFFLYWNQFQYLNRRKQISY